MSFWSLILLLSFFSPCLGFSAGEHAIIGDNAYPTAFAAAPSEVKSALGPDNNILLFPGEPHKSVLSFGEMVALAGDFLGPTNGLPIGLLSNPVRLIETILPSSNMHETIKAYVEQSIRPQYAVIRDYGGTARLVPKYTEVATVSDIEAIAISRMEKAVLAPSSLLGTQLAVNSVLQSSEYIDLAKVNYDHFADNDVARNAYSAVHKYALGLARDYASSKNVEKLRMAVTYDAIACHYLTDLFAAGHMRTPRYRLSLTCQTADTASVMSLCMHDEDNLYGLWVKSPKGVKWRAFGDKALFSPQSGSRNGDHSGNLNFQQAVSAVSASLGEVFAQAVTTSDVSSGSAFEFVGTPMGGSKNHPPLYYVDSREKPWHRVTPPWQSAAYEPVTRPCIDDAALCKLFQGYSMSQCFKTSPSSAEYEFASGQCELADVTLAQSDSTIVSAFNAAVSAMDKAVVRHIDSCAGDTECRSVEDNPCSAQCFCAKKGSNKCLCLKRANRPCVEVEDMSVDTMLEETTGVSARKASRHLRRHHHSATAHRKKHK